MAHEIMENDNMFSVLETPWHGLGVVLDSPPTIEEALIQASLDWTVEKMPLFYNVGDNNFLEIDSRKAMMRMDTMEVMGVVGSNYTPLQNVEAFNIFRPLVETKDILLETAGSLKNGRRVWILARINTDGAEIAKNDEVKPYVLLSNAHDGTMAVRFGFTPIRVVCNNTLSMAEFGGSSKLIRLYHMGNVVDNLETLRDMLDLSKAKFTASIEQYRLLASKEINQTDLEKYVKIVFDKEFEKALEEAREKDEPIEYILTPTQNKIVELFETGRGSDLAKSKTWWGAYNAVNEWLMYSHARTVDNRMNSVWYGDGYYINNRAMETALKLAA